MAQRMVDRAVSAPNSSAEAREEREDSMADSTERDSNSQSEFADDESEGSCVLEQIQHTAAVGEAADSHSESEFADDESEGSSDAGEQIQHTAAASEDAVLNEAPMEADGSGGSSLAAYDQVFPMATRPDNIVKQELIPENNLDDGDEVDDLRRVVIKEEIDLGEEWIKGESGIDSSSDYLRLFSLGLNIKDEATDEEDEPVVKQETPTDEEDEPVVKQETPDTDIATDDQVPDPTSSNNEKNAIEDKIAIKVEAADSDHTIDEQIPYQSASKNEINSNKIAIKVEAASGDEDGTEDTMTGQPANYQTAASTQLIRIKQEIPSEDAAGDPGNKSVDAPLQQISIKQETPSATIQEAPPAVPTTAEGDPGNIPVSAPTKLIRIKQETPEAIQEGLRASQTAAAGDPGNNQVAAPTAQISNNLESPSAAIPDTSREPWTVAAVKAVKNNNVILLHEVPVVSSHSDGTDLIGALLVSQGAGGGRQWHKLYDAEGRELCLGHFLQYRKRKWLAIGVSEDGGNSHTGAKEARLGQASINLKELIGAYRATGSSRLLPQCTVGPASQIPAAPAPGTQRQNEEAGASYTANGSRPSYQNSDKPLTETEEKQPVNQNPEN